MGSYTQCNREIGALEWRERVFGDHSQRLTIYRQRFPVPRKPLMWPVLPHDAL